MRCLWMGGLFVSLLTVGLASGQQNAGKAKKPAPPVVSSVEGTIKVLDSSTGRLVLIVGKKPEAFLVSRATKFLGVDDKELADGILAKDITIGAKVALKIEVDPKRPRQKQVKEMKLMK